MSGFGLLFKITRTHLLSRKKQTSIAALGVTFGIGTFIIMMGFMTGLNGLLDGLVLNRTPHVHIFNEIEPSKIQPIERSLPGETHIIQSIKPKTNVAKVHNALPLMAELRRDKRVLGVTSQLSAKIFYAAGAIDLNGAATGIDVKEENRLYNFSNYVTQGEAMGLHRDKNSILLGAGVADKLGLKLGDKIQIKTPQGGLFPLKIVGIYQSGLAEVDNIQSFVNLETAQRLMGVGNTYVTDVNIKLHDVNQAVQFTNEVIRRFEVNAVDINTANAQFDTGTSIRNLITYAVSITLLVVAGFGIYNILNMLIYEKMDDIAILKATGFSGNDVSTIFISQAVVIGFVGGTLGLIFGFIGCWVISKAPFDTEALPTVKTYPVNFNPMFYVIGIVFAMVSTFLAGYLPARKAKRIDPVEIIRGK